MSQAKGRGCWYFISEWWCVLCGRSEQTRERRWTPKPKRAEDRYEYTEGACGDHFC